MVNTVVTAGFSRNQGGEDAVNVYQDRTPHTNITEQREKQMPVVKKRDSKQKNVRLFAHSSKQKKNGWSDEKYTSLTKACACGNIEDVQSMIYENTSPELRHIVTKLFYVACRENYDNAILSFLGKYDGNILTCEFSHKFEKSHPQHSYLLIKQHIITVVSHIREGMWKASQRGNRNALQTLLKLLHLQQENTMRIIENATSARHQKLALLKSTFDQQTRITKNRPIPSTHELRETQDLQLFAEEQFSAERDDALAEALWTASYRGQNDLIAYFVQKQITIYHRCGKNLWTPLIAACEAAWWKLTTFLLSKELFTDILCETREKNSAMHLVIWNGRKFGKTFLHVAIEADDKTEVKNLIYKGADVDAQDNLGRTPLHLACSRRDLDSVKLLVAALADVSITNDANQTPFAVAKSAAYGEIVDYLERSS